MSDKRVPGAITYTDSLTLPKVRCLIYGRSGTGKTCSNRTFPFPLVLDFDGGGLSLRSEHIAIVEMRDVYNATGKAVIKSACDLLWEKVELAEKGLLTDEKGKKFETLVIDSVTTYQEYKTDELCRLSGKSVPSLAEWNVLIDDIKNLFLRLKGLDMNIVVIAHELVLVDEISGEVMVLPLVAGKKLPTRMPLFFDEVYHSEVQEEKDGKQKFVWLMGATKKYVAKTRLSGLSNLFEKYELQDYRVLAEKLAEQEKSAHKGQEQKGGEAPVTATTTKP